VGLALHIVGQVGVEASGVGRRAAAHQVLGLGRFVPGGVGGAEAALPDLVPDEADALENLIARFDETGTLQEEEDLSEIGVAIIGRTNVGKSSLLNALLGHERAIVSDIPGTTRDVLDTRLKWEGRRVVLVDTAGIRRRGAIKPGLERYSVIRALRAVQRADVALVLIDATEGPTAQDTYIAGYVVEEGRGLVLVVNKWDAIEKDAYTMNEFREEIRSRFDFAPWAPLLFISARTRQRVHQVIPTAYRVWESARHRIPTAELNRIVQNAVLTHPPSLKRGRGLKFFYATQVGEAPPTFVIFVNDPDMVHFSYQRYLENRLRERYPFEGTPIRMIFRERKGRKNQRGR
jgi:GTP-binding protein